MKKIVGSIAAIAILAIGIATTADAGRGLATARLNDGTYCFPSLHVWVTRNRAYGHTDMPCNRTIRQIFMYHSLVKQGDWNSFRGYVEDHQVNIKKLSITSSVQCIGNRRSMWGIKTTAQLWDTRGYDQIYSQGWTSVNNLNCS